MTKGKDACRWCEGEGKLFDLDLLGFPACYTPCTHCEGTGDAANPAPPAGEGEPGREA